MKLLFFDTNIIVQDFQLNSHLFNTLFLNVGAVANRIIIPKVVYDETISQFKKKVDEERQKALKALKNINTISGKNISNETLSDENALLNDYVKYFDSLIEKNKIQIADYPSVDHEYLAKKSMQRHKPFKASGEGYCDSLIWETIKQHLKKYPEDKIIFLTNNSKDFCSENKLHDQLLAELSEIKISDSNIELFTSLQSLSEQKIFPHLKSLKDWKDKINNNSIPNIDFTWWLQEKLWGAFDGSDLMFLLGDLNEKECEIEISEIYSISKINVEDAWLIGESKKYISFTADIGVGVNLCAEYHNYHSSSKIKQLFEEYDGSEPLPYDCVYIGELMEFDLSIIIENDDFENASLEIISISYKSRSVDFKN